MGQTKPSLERRDKLGDDVPSVQLFMVTNTQMKERERNVLFNDALNTFYLRLYGVRHMVKDHSDSEKGNPLLPHRLQQGIFYMHHPTDRITHTTAFVTPVMNTQMKLVLFHCHFSETG